MNYKIKTGPVNISSGNINQHKNFDGVYQKYQYAGFPNSFWNAFNGKTILAGLISTGVIISIIYYANHRINKSIASPFINPPFSAVQTPFTDYTLDASKGGRFEYVSGSVINIPAGILINKKGKEVKGQVQIRYREFPNPKEFFLSGIPMDYDTGGKTYAFESAGMFEMRAFQNNEPLFIQKGKDIQVDLVATHHGDDFCLYYLNEDKRKWDFKGNYERKEDPVKIDETILDSLVRNEIKKNSKITKKIEPPTKPIHANPKRYRFDFEYDKSEFPELANYDGMTFEIKEGQNFSPSLYDIVWPDIKLEKVVNKSSEYKLTLSNGKASRKFIVYPVIEDSSKYEEAVLEYEKRYEQYKIDLNKRNKEEQLERENYKAELEKRIKNEQINKARLEERQKRQEEIEREWVQENSEVIKEIQKQNFLSGRTMANEVINTLKIEGFGIWNCDRISGYPNKKKLKVYFINYLGERLILDCYYHIDCSKNSIFSYQSFRSLEFGYDPNQQNMIWAALGENKLGIVREDQFQKIPDHATEYTFTMEIIDKEFKDPNEIRELLSFQKEILP